ncbi:MAG: PAQR family membrane homeostasis protein TrhA [Paracoccaceae bacterium]
MSATAYPRREYDRAELVSDAALHLGALAVALIAVPVLIAVTARLGATGGAIVGVAVYGAALIAMLTASWAYNHLPRPGWVPWLRKVDMTFIWVLIAGTCTAFAALSATAATFLYLIWGAAGAAVAFTLFARRHPTSASVAIGLTMGWAVLWGGREMIAAVSWPVLILMIAGGVLYSAGTPFLLAARMRFHNTIWHGFVVAASALFFAAIAVHAAQSAPV